MICVVIPGPTYEDAQQQIAQVVSYADLIELRLDYFDELDSLKINKLRSLFSIPTIFTLRSQTQGGNYRESEEKRLEKIEELAALQPEYFDIESDVSLLFIEKFIEKYPEIKLIISYHNFKETPIDLDDLYSKMKRIPAFHYKMALMANNILDSLNFLLWVKNLEEKPIAISLGLNGEVTRILSPIVGSPFTYACVDNERQTAPGQLTAQILKERYHYSSLHPEKALYGLIGDPVEGSISDITHNKVINNLNINAVYVKMQVKSTELQKFLHLVKKLPFKGLSVTMPLKEAIIPYLDEIDPEAKQIGAVNTLLIKDGKIYGMNTDGIGALNAIEEKTAVREKRIVMIGAGGAAKAIVFEAIKRRANVTVLNRDKEKAQQLALQWNCQAKGLNRINECFEEGYDILINCTPLPMPILPQHILPKIVAMDIKTRPKVTPFLDEALKKSCHVIYGYEMFIEQAIGQFQIWLENYHCNNIKCDLKSIVKDLSNL